MKNLLLSAMLGAFVTIGALAEKAPVLYYELGTTRNDVLFDMGEPKYRLPDGHLLYEVYSGVRTLETVTFYFDEDSRLDGYSIDIGLDLQRSALPLEEFQNRVFQHYKDAFESLYGEPYISNQVGMAWKFDDGFSVFQPYIRETFLRFHFMFMRRELAEDLGYGQLYDQAE